MMLEEVRPGSFIITWLIPESIVGLLMKDVPEDLLGKFSIVKFEVDGETLYQSGTSYTPPSSSHSSELGETLYQSKASYTPSSSSYSGDVGETLYQSRASYVSSSSGYSTELKETLYQYGASYASSSSGYSSGLGSTATLNESNAGPKGKKDCINYKLLGECSDEWCRLAHNNTERTLFSTVELPTGVPVSYAMKGDFVRQLRQIAEFCFKSVGNNAVRIVVSCKNALLLPKLVEEYEFLLVQWYSRGKSICYVHKEGIAECSMLKFTRYERTLPLVPGKPRKHRTEEWFELCKVEGLELTSSTASQLLGKVSSGQRTDNSEIMFVEDHLDHIQRVLTESLEACYKDKKDSVYLKLEGRYGKLVWNRVPQYNLNHPFYVADFKTLCSTDSNISWLFSPGIKDDSVGMVKEMLHQKEKHSSVLETYGIKLVMLRENKRISVILRFDHDRPIVQRITKNENKISVFDVLNLHRSHDVRLSLGQSELVQEGSPEHDVVEQLLKTLSHPELDETIKLVPTTDTWCVGFIRHKKIKTYHFTDKCILTISDVADCQLSRTSQKHEEILIYPEFYTRRCTELELHHTLWECAFGRSIGLSQEQSLALLMDSPAVEPEVAAAIPHPWQPEHILQDFHEFWRNLDTLNDAMTPFL